MAVRMLRDDDQPIRVIEAYYDLEAGQAVEARLNDVGIAAGTVGTVVRQVRETGNWQCVFDVAGGRRRVVALTPDQLRPAGAAAPVRGEELQLIADAHDPVQHDDARRQAIREATVARFSTEEVKARRKAGLAAYHERRRAEKAAAELLRAEAMLRGDGPISLPEPEPEPEVVPQTVQGEGFAAAFLRENVRPDYAGELPVDWLAIAERQIRDLLASAATRATWREMGTLWEIGRWLEERRESAA